MSDDTFDAFDRRPTAAPEPEAAEAQQPEAQPQPEPAESYTPRPRPQVNPSDLFDFDAKGYDPTQITGTLARQHFAGEIEAATKAKQAQGALDTFDAEEMYRQTVASQREAKAAEASQQREAKAAALQEKKQTNADREADFRTRGVQQYTDAFGNIQPVRDEAGGIRFHKHEGEIQYDDRGAFKINRDESGKATREDLDKDAPIGTHKDAPNQLFKQNSKAPWTPLGSVQEGLESTDPKVKDAAEAAQTKLHKVLHADVSKGFAEEGFKLATQELNDRAAYKTAKPIYDALEDQITAVKARSEATQGFIGFREKTPDAIKAGDELKELREQQKKINLNDPDSIIPGENGKTYKQTLAEKKALLSTNKKAFDDLVEQHDGDVDAASEQWAQQSAARGEDTSKDPILARLEKKRAELGMPTQADKQAAQDAQMRANPETAFFPDQRDAIAAEHGRAIDDIRKKQEATAAQLGPVRTQIEQGRAQIEELQSQYAAHEKAVDKLLPASDDPEASWSDRLDGASAEQRAAVQVHYDAMKPLREEANKRSTELQPLIEGHNATADEAQRSATVELAEARTAAQEKSDALNAKFEALTKPASQIKDKNGLALDFQDRLTHGNTSAQELHTAVAAGVISRDEAMAALQKHSDARAALATAQQDAQEKNWQGATGGKMVGAIQTAFKAGVIGPEQASAMLLDNVQNVVKHSDSGAGKTTTAFNALTHTVFKSLDESAAGIFRFIGLKTVGDYIATGAEKHAKALAGEEQAGMYAVNPALKNTFTTQAGEAAGEFIPMLAGMLATEGTATLAKLPAAVRAFKVLQIPALGQKFAGLAPFALQMAGQSGEQGYEQAGGSEAQKMAAGWKAAEGSLPGLLIFGAQGEMMGALTNRAARVLPILDTPFRRGLATFTTAAAGNVATSAGLREMEHAGGWKDATLQSTAQDIAWGGLSAMHASSAAKYLPTAHAIASGQHPEVMILEGMGRSDKFSPEVKKMAAEQAETLKADAGEFLKSMGYPVPENRTKVATETLSKMIVTPDAAAAKLGATDTSGHGQKLADVNGRIADLQLKLIHASSGKADEGARGQLAKDLMAAEDERSQIAHEITRSSILSDASKSIEAIAPEPGQPADAHDNTKEAARALVKLAGGAGEEHLTAGERAALDSPTPDKVPRYEMVKGEPVFTDATIANMKELASAGKAPGEPTWADHLFNESEHDARARLNPPQPEPETLAGHILDGVKKTPKPAAKPEGPRSVPQRTTHELRALNPEEEKRAQVLAASLGGVSRPLAERFARGFVGKHGVGDFAAQGRAIRGEFEKAGGEIPPTATGTGAEAQRRVAKRVNAELHRRIHEQDAADANKAYPAPKQHVTVKVGGRLRELGYSDEFILNTKREELDRIAAQGIKAGDYEPPTQKKPAMSKEEKAAGMKALVVAAHRQFKEALETGGRKLTDEENENLKNAAAKLAPALALYNKAFRGVKFSDEESPAGSGFSTHEGELTIHIGDLLHESKDEKGAIYYPQIEALLAHPDRAVRVIQEEALHAIADRLQTVEEWRALSRELKGELRSNALRGYFDGRAIEEFNELRERAEGGVKLNAAEQNKLANYEHQLGQETFRMYLQSRFKAREITEQTLPKLAGALAGLFKKLLRFFDKLADTMRASGADEKTITLFEDLARRALAEHQKIVADAREVHPYLEKYGESSTQLRDSGLQQGRDGGVAEADADRAEREKRESVAAAGGKDAGGGAEPGAELKPGEPVPAGTETTTTLPKDDYTVYEQPLAALGLLKNFKEDADATTGVVRGEQLRPGEEHPTYDRHGPPILVWERADGARLIASGRHRADLARRAGEKTIPSQLVREADGWSEAKVKALDAEMNIRDGNGSIKDYANFFKHSGITDAEAKARGLLDRPKGQAGFTLGRDATNDLYSLYAAKKLSEAKALAIVRAAPRDEALQKVGVHFALITDPGANAESVGERVRAAVAFPSIREAAEQDELFGANDKAMQAMNNAAEAAMAMRRDINKDVSILQDAQNRNKADALKLTDAEAARFGIADKNNVEEIRASLTKHEAEAERWKEWHLPQNKDLMDRIKLRVAEKNGLSARPAANTERFSRRLRELEAKLLKEGKLAPDEERQRISLEKQFGQGFMQFFDKTNTAKPAGDLTLETQATGGAPKESEQMALFARPSPERRKAARELVTKADKQLGKFYKGVEERTPHFMPILDAMRKLGGKVQRSLVGLLDAHTLPAAPAALSQPIREAVEKYEADLKTVIARYKKAYEAYKREFTPEIQRGFRDKVNGIAADLGLTPWADKVELKGDRAIEKAWQDNPESPDVTTIKDVLRASIIAETDEEVARAAAEIKKRFGIDDGNPATGKHKDRFSKPIMGYRDHLLQVKLPNGRFAEIQVHRADLIFAKEIGIGHAIYAMHRQLPAVIKASPEHADALDAWKKNLEAESAKFYADAEARYLGSEKKSASEISSPSSETRASLYARGGTASNAHTSTPPPGNTATGSPLTEKNLVPGGKGGAGGSGIQPSHTGGEGERQTLSARKAPDGRFIASKELEDDPDFKERFAGSVVTDTYGERTNRAGRPLMVFHGTARGFDKFDPARTSKARGDGLSFGPGVYFTEQAKHADDAATLPSELNPGIDTEPNVRPAFLKVHDPFDTERTYTARELDATRGIMGSGELVKRARKEGGLKGAEVYKALADELGGRKAANNALQHIGFDGIAAKLEGPRMWVVFDPEEQVIPAYAPASLSARKAPREDENQGGFGFDFAAAPKETKTYVKALVKEGHKEPKTFAAAVRHDLGTGADALELWNHAKAGEPTLPAAKREDFAPAPQPSAKALKEAKALREKARGIHGIVENYDGEDYKRLLREAEELFKQADELERNAPEQKTYTSKELLQYNPDSPHEDDFPDREWKRENVRISDINFRATERDDIAPPDGSEPPAILIPNTRASFSDGANPDAKWFTEDGRHRVIAAIKSGAKTIDAFTLIGPDNSAYEQNPLTPATAGSKDNLTGEQNADEPTRPAYSRTKTKVAPDDAMGDLFQRLVGEREPEHDPGMAGGAEARPSSLHGSANVDVSGNAGSGAAADRNQEPGDGAGSANAIGGRDDGARNALPGTGGDGTGTADTGRAGEGARASRRGAEPAQVERPTNPAERNYVIERGAELAPRGTMGKLRANLDAIRLLKSIESEQRPASDEERAALVKYSGWGAISQAFDDEMADSIARGEIEERQRTAERYRNMGESEYYTGEVERQEAAIHKLEAWRDKWGDAHKQLIETLTPEEYDRAKRSTINAHYTAPEVISGMWDIARRLGFKGGNVLEPAAGIGHFFGLMPADMADRAKLHAVELDDLSGRITKMLYPEADVQIRGFQNADIADNSIDLAISNVPFANVPVTDKALEAMGGPTDNLHDYFFGKTLTKLRPGGLMLYITSAFTLDKGNAENRRWLAERADLVAAYRLPNDAFKKNAGTQVVTDILVLRKKDGKPFAHGQEWTSLDEATARNGEAIRINEYFARHPQNILGLLANDGEMYGGDEKEMTVHSDPNRPAEIALQQAIGDLPADIAGDGAAGAVRTGAAEGVKFGNIIERDGKFHFQGQEEPDADLNLPKNRERVQRFMRVRDALNKQYELELSPTATEEEIEGNRAALNSAYDTFLSAHKDFHWRENKKLFIDDPDFFRLAGAEVPEKIEGGIAALVEAFKGREVQKYRKADVFTKRVLNPRSEPTHADSLQDAFGMSLGWRGGVDAGFIADLTGQSREQVERSLIEQEIAVRDPATGQILSREQYLSGNVRKKLEIAQAAGPDYARNVAMLEPVIPKDVSIEDARFKIGATWIPAATYERFLHSIGLGGVKLEYHTGADGGRDFWSMDRAKKFKPGEGLAYKDFETPRVTVPEMMDSMLNMKRITLFGTEKETRDIKDEVATTAARDAAKRLNAAFVDWVRSTKDVGDELAGIFNREINGFAKRTYDGQFLTLPWANKDFDIYPDKKNVVWRAIQEGYGLIAHGVGGGKTIIAGAIALEMRRLGLSRKPMIVVHNATLEQFADTLAQMAPSARILVGRKDELSGPKRKEFLMRIAAGDWDAVVIAHSTFGLIEDDPVYQRKHLEATVDEVWQSLKEDGFDNMEDAKKGGRHNQSVKARVKTIERLEEKLQALSLRRTDAGLLNFQQLGVDSLIVDEVHKFKKVGFSSKLDVKGIDSDFSARGYALMMRARYIQEKMGGKNVFTMTGTPVTNTLGEIWNMIRLVAPKLLKEYKIEYFDQFVSKFAETESRSEQTPGGDYNMVERLAKVVNLPEWNTLFRMAADVKLGDDMSVKNRPGIKGGKPELVTVERTPGMTAWVSYIREVLDGFSQLTGEDFAANPSLNAVPVQAYMASRAAAIDIRLIDGRAADEPGSKVNMMLKSALEIYHRTTPYKGTQVIFADSMNSVKTGLFSAITGTGGLEKSLNLDLSKSKSGFNLYDDIRRKLILQGVPESEIAVMSDAKYHSDKARKALFAAVNAGKVRIIMGSTEKLGTGVNMQRLMIAAHHLDVPWTPADLEQRDGRVYRDGNIHGEMGVPVELRRYGMKDSLDAALWQKLENKARFIVGALSGKLTGRELEEADDVLTLSEQRAILSGPHGQEMFELETRIRELHAGEAGYEESRSARRHEIRMAQAVMAGENKAAEAREPALQAMHSLGEKVEKDGAQITVHGKAFETKTAMLEAVNAALENARKDAEAEAAGWKDGVTYIAVNGERVQLVPEVQSGFSYNHESGKSEELRDVSFKLVPVGGRIEGLDFGRVTSAATLLSRLEELRETVDNTRQATRNNLARLDQIAHMEEMAEWPQRAELDAAQARLKEVRGLAAGEKKKGKKDAATPEELTDPAAPGANKAQSAEESNYANEGGGQLEGLGARKAGAREHGSRFVKDDKGELKTFYHGTPQAAELVASGKFDEGKASREALYGPGFYFTDDPGTAGGDNKVDGYANARHLDYDFAGGDVVLEQARAEVQKQRDILAKHPDANGNARLLKKAESFLASMEFAKSEAEKSSPGVLPAYLDVRNPFEADDPKQSAILSEKTRLAARAIYEARQATRRKNELEAFKFVSSAAATAGYMGETVFEYVRQIGQGRLQELNEVLRKVGYDGITHVGGGRTGNKPHRVVIAFKPEQVIGKYGGDERKAGDMALFARKAGDDEGKSAHTLIGEYRPMAEKIAGAYDNIRGVEAGDVRQRALIALTKAARGWKAEKGPFEPYAAASVRNELRGFYGEQKAASRFVTTLDAASPRDETGLETNKDNVPDRSADVRNEVGLRETTAILDKLIDELPKHLRDVVLGIREGRSLAEIGESLGKGITKQGASNRAKIAMTRLRQKLAERGITGYEDGALNARKAPDSFKDEEREQTKFLIRFAREHHMGLDELAEKRFDLFTQAAEQWRDAHPHDEVSPEELHALATRAAPGRDEEFDPYEAIRDLIKMSARELEGQRTIGRPDLAHGADSPEKMGVDQFYTEHGDKENMEQWQESAAAKLRHDHEGTAETILRKARTGEGITASESFAAQQLHVDYLKKWAETGDETYKDKAAEMWLSYREAKGDVARAMAAGRDLFKTPADRMREFIGRNLFEPPRDVQKKLDDAKTPGERQKILDGEKARVSQIESELAKMGVSLKDLIAGEVDLRLKGARMMKNSLEGFAAKERQALEMFTKGERDLSVIQKKTGLNAKQIEAVRQKMIADFRAKQFAKFKAGATLANLDTEGLSARAAEVSDAQAEAEFQKFINAMGLGDKPVSKFDINNPAHVAKIGRMIAATQGNAADMVHEWWINSILSGPKTHLAIFAGASLHAAWEMTAQRGMEAMVNSALSLIGKGDAGSAQWGEFSHIARGIVPGCVKGFRNALEAFDAERSLFGVKYGGEKMDMDSDAFRNSSRVAIPGKFGRAVRVPGRTIQFLDEFFKTVFGHLQVGAEAYRIAKGEGLEKEAMQSRIKDLIAQPGSEAWMGAVKKAKYLMLQSPLRTKEQGGGLSEQAAHAIQTMSQDFPGARYFIPFVRIGHNILSAGVSKSPLGTLGMIGRFAHEGLYHFKDGQVNLRPYARGEVIRDLAQQVLAWGATALLYGMAGDDDEKKGIHITGAHTLGRASGEKGLDKRTGNDAFTIRYGRHLFDYSRYEPLATVLGVTIDTINTIKKLRKGNEASAALGGFASQLAGQFTEKTYGRGLDEMSKVVSDPKEAGNWIANFAASFVPNLIRQPLRNYDPVERETSVEATAKDFTGELAHKIAGLAVPGLSSAPRVDFYGRDITKGGNSALRALMPGNLHDAPEAQRGDTLLKNWNREHPEEAYAPAPPQRTYKDALGRAQTMSDEEFHEYSRIAGEKVLRGLRGLSSRAVENPRDEDVRAFKETVSAARREAKEQVLRQKGRRVDVRKALWN